MILGKQEHLVEETLPPHGGGPHVGIQLELQSYCEATVLITVPSCCHLEVIKSLVGKCSFQSFHFRSGLIPIHLHFASFCVYNVSRHYLCMPLFHNLNFPTQKREIMSSLKCVSSRGMTGHSPFDTVHCERNAL